MTLHRSDKYKLARSAKTAEANGDAEWAEALNLHLATVSTVLLRMERVN